MGTLPLTLVLLLRQNPPRKREKILVSKGGWDGYNWWPKTNLSAPASLTSRIRSLIRHGRERNVIGWSNSPAPYLTSALSMVNLGTSSKVPAINQDTHGPWTECHLNAFLNLLPLVATGHLRMLDKPEPVAELKALQRRPDGRIVKPTAGFDDYANALAISAVLAAQKKKTILMFGPAGSVKVFDPSKNRTPSSPHQIPTAPPNPNRPAFGAARGWGRDGWGTDFRYE